MFNDSVIISTIIKILVINLKGQWFFSIFHPYAEYFPSFKFLWRNLSIVEVIKLLINEWSRNSVSSGHAVWCKLRSEIFVWILLSFDVCCQIAKEIPNALNPNLPIVNMSIFQIWLTVNHRVHHRSSDRSRCLLVVRGSNCSMQHCGSDLPLSI